MQKDILSLRDMPKEDITQILDSAKAMHAILDAPNKKAPHLQGKSIVTLFYENSTRTRMSFELGSKYLSAVAANIAASASSVSKGETLLDTGRTLDAMGTDVIIMRHPLSGAPHLLAKHVRSSIINAGDGTNEHPTQALLDLYALRQRKGEIKGLKVCIVGDVLHSRVARSNVFGLTTMGAQVVLCGPPTLLPPHAEALGVKVTRKLDEALCGADVVMGLRVQRERQTGGAFPSDAEYMEHWGITRERLRLCDAEHLIMHPGPMNRGVEIASDVADAANSLIGEQVTAGVAVRMALLYLLTRRKI